jgi:hypothetical protein
MPKTTVSAAQDFCDMTVVPGGIIEYACFQPVPFPTWDYPPRRPSLLSSPIWVAALNRTISLTPKPISHSYNHQIQSFETAYDPLFQFLKKESFEYEETGNTRTVLFLDQYSDKLVAYCSTKCSSLKTGGNKLLSLCPSIEIAALCVDDRFRYMGVGHSIFNHVIRRVYDIKNLTGVQLITLFAVPDAVGFYYQLQFRRITKGMKILSTPVHQSCVPMYLPLANANVEAG